MHAKFQLDRTSPFKKGGCGVILHDPHFRTKEKLSEIHYKRDKFCLSMIGTLSLLTSILSSSSNQANSSIICKPKSLTKYAKFAFSAVFTDLRNVECLKFSSIYTLCFVQK